MNCVICSHILYAIRTRILNEVDNNIKYVRVFNHKYLVWHLRLSNKFIVFKNIKNKANVREQIIEK